jgi:endonuclease/exonuclease/phosphatase family metal-dependent hydrolase
MRLRLATFNVENLGDDPKASVLLQDRLAVLRPQLEALAADVLCLQEVHAQREGPGTLRQLRALRTLLEGTRYQHCALIPSVGPRGDGPQDHHNLVVVTHLPIQTFESLHHRFVPPPSWRSVTANPPQEAAQPVAFDRPAQHVALTLPGGRTLHVFNVHLRAPLAAPVPGQKEGPFVWRSTPGWAEGFLLAAWKSTAQALDVRLAVDAVLDGDPNAWVVVAGDFNAGERETPVRLLCADPEDTGNGALAGRSLHPLALRVGEPQRYTVLHAGQARVLDHVLCSRGMLPFVTQVAIHNAGLPDEVVAEHLAPPPPESHHAPMVVEFDVP